MAVASFRGGGYWLVRSASVSVFRNAMTSRISALLRAGFAPGLPAEGRVAVDVLAVRGRQVVERLDVAADLRVPLAGARVALDVERHHLRRACGRRRCERTRAARRRCAATARGIPRSTPGERRGPCASGRTARGRGRRGSSFAGSCAVARHAERVEAEVGELGERAVVAGARVAARAVALARIVEEREAALLARR